MAFAWTSIKTESLDTFGNSLKIYGSNTGSGVVLKVLIERTQTVGGKTTTSELTSNTFFVPGETVSSLGSMTLTTLLTTAAGTTRTVKASQVTKGTIFIEYSTAKIEQKGKTKDQFSFEMTAFFIPQATISASDVAGGRYFHDDSWSNFLPKEAGFRQHAESVSGVIPYNVTITLSPAPSVNSNMRSSLNILSVRVGQPGLAGSGMVDYAFATATYGDEYHWERSGGGSGTNVYIPKVHVVSGLAVVTYIA
jgi:hypothetical protein